MTVRRAAEACRVPKSTLHDRLSGKIVFGATSGPKSCKQKRLKCQCLMVGGMALNGIIQILSLGQQHLSYCRAVASSPEIIHRYYDLLEQTLLDNNLFNSPSQIFDMDETGLPLEPDLPLVVVVKGQKHVVCVTTGNKAQITTAAACNAAGYAIPPMVIFDRKCRLK